MLKGWLLEEVRTLRGRLHRPPRWWYAVLIAGLALTTWSDRDQRQRREASRQLAEAIDAGDIVPYAWRGGGLERTIHVLDGGLVGPIEDLMRTSPTFRAMAEGIGQHGRPVWIGSNDAVGIARSGAVGEVVGTTEPSGLRYDSYRIAVARDLLTRLYRHYLRPGPLRPIGEAALEGELKATLAHEIAHVYSLARGGGWTWNLCGDPMPWEADLESCVMEWENRIRREAGLPIAEHYGVRSPGRVVQSYGWPADHW